MLVLSSILFYYASMPNTKKHEEILTVKIAKELSIILRRIGKTIASLNAIWIIVLCLFQFSNFFNRCWCNSSVLGLGPEMAYDVIKLLPEDISSMRGAWYGGIFLAAGTAAIFVLNRLSAPCLFHCNSRFLNLQLIESY